MAGLPPAATEEAFAAIRQDEASLRPGIEQLCQRLDLDAARLTRYTAGSRPVFGTGDLVLKLFPPVTTWPRWQMEPEVLAAVQGSCRPRLHRCMRLENTAGGGYVLMSRLRGIPLGTVWDQVPAAGRDRLADQLGETIAALHQLPPPAIRDWWPADWPGFVAQQHAQCVGEQRDLGLPAAWADQIPRFLDAVALPLGTPVLLHTEVMREHLLVTAEGLGGTWRLSGLIDFEPAMRGEREYEFVAVGVFVAEGDARFLAVPAACPIGQSSAGTYGHSRTTRYTGSPAHM